MGRAAGEALWVCRRFRPGRTRRPDRRPHQPPDRGMPDERGQQGLRLLREAPPYARATLRGRLQDDHRVLHADATIGARHAILRDVERLWAARLFQIGHRPHRGLRTRATWRQGVHALERLVPHGRARGRRAMRGALRDRRRADPDHEPRPRRGRVDGCDGQARRIAHHQGTRCRNCVGRAVAAERDRCTRGSHERHPDGRARGAVLQAPCGA
mmetsp:Transcript_76624/g.194424  ORF Transcript_76624/g.194424 Transcript_76624/m.194424 type:complete len:213 (+) Transcript_76624:1149-1787(+)